MDSKSSETVLLSRHCICRKQFPNLPSNAPTACQQNPLTPRSNYSKSNWILGHFSLQSTWVSVLTRNKVSQSRDHFLILVIKFDSIFTSLKLNSVVILSNLNSIFFLFSLLEGNGNKQTNKQKHQNCKFKAARRRGGKSWYTTD